MAEPPAAWAAPDAARVRPAPPGAARAGGAAGASPVGAPTTAGAAGPGGISGGRAADGVGGATQDPTTPSTQQSTTPRIDDEARPERPVSSGLRPIPLRPLTALETIDAAVGSVRALEPRLLGWGMAGATALTAAAVGIGWIFDAAVSHAVVRHATDTFDFLGDETVQFGARSPETLISLAAAQAMWLLAVSGMAVTVLGGLFAKPVRRYIDGLPTNGNGHSAHSSAAIAPAKLAGRLCVIAVVCALPRMVLAGVFAVIALASANNPNSGYGGFIALAYLATAVVVWLFTSQWAVAAPACALEGLAPAAALLRSGRLAVHGRWRVAWTALMAFAVLVAVTAPAGFAAEQLYVSHGLGSMDTGADQASLADPAWFLPLCAVAALTLPLTIPIRATLADMQYVDRRFRREGMDIRIAWARSAKAAAAGRAH